jgi:ribosomal protein S18 acetylase RimI-like enzyme
MFITDTISASRNIDMNIRRAVLKDIDGINSLLFQVAAVHSKGRGDLFRTGTKKYNDEQLSKLIADDKRPIFVAVDECDKVLGYAFCIFKQYLDDNVLTDIKTLYIDDLCIDENVRGQHIGKSIYEFVKNFAKENDCYNLTLNVWACNEGAMRFYEAVGLKPQKIGMETIL